MRCRLCGDEITNAYHPQRIWCRPCDTVIDSWHGRAYDQMHKTGRLPKIEITFKGEHPTVKVDSSGGFPNPNKFVENPPEALPPSDWVRIEVPNREAVRSSNNDIMFYLKLKRAEGCVSKQSGRSDSMQLYIQPGSPAAALFIDRMRALHGKLLPEHRGLLQIGDGS